MGKAQGNGDAWNGQRPGCRGGEGWLARDLGILSEASGEVLEDFRSVLQSRLSHGVAGAPPW